MLAAAPLLVIVGLGALAGAPTGALDLNADPTEQDYLFGRGIAYPL